MLRIIAFMLAAACILICGCAIGNKGRQISDNLNEVTGPKIYIYKTRGDYNNQVPVDLSADQKTIVFYPDIKDVFYNGKLATPTMLEDGFLLDNRGISSNVAFLKLTYRQYAALPSTPSSESLFNLILDSEPLTFLYDCGRMSDYQNLTNDLNNLIKAKDFSKFRKLK